MVAYLHALLAERMMRGAEEVSAVVRGAHERRLQETRSACPSDTCMLVESYARRIGNDYHDGVLHQLHKMFWHEIHDGETPEEYITWNEAHRNTWMHGVATQRSVRLRYDSQTSGETERLVDPYHTRGAYGIGYCHLRKEMRMFRFDRVIAIEGTVQQCTRPKDWKKRWDAQQRARADAMV